MWMSVRASRQRSSCSRAPVTRECPSPTRMASNSRASSLRHSRAAAGRVVELLVGQQAQPSHRRADHQVARQDHLPIRPVQGDLARALAVLQVHGPQTGEDLPLADGAVDAHSQGARVGLVGDHLGAGALTEGAGLALVVAVGDHDPGRPAEAVELGEVGLDHGYRIEEDVPLLPYPQVAVEVDLPVLVEDGPAVTCRGRPASWGATSWGG